MPHRSASPDPLAPPARLDHGAIGNGRVIALVSPTGSMDWLCMPRFDDPSVFSRLLDSENGGAFRILGPDGGEVRGEMTYVRNTNVLATVLAGFGGTGPVRIGNAAALQRQNDLCGGLVLSIDALLGDPRVEPGAANGLFPLITRLVEEAIAAAPTMDTGIWEFRSLLRHYTFSRVMCWAAADRGARLARRLGHPDAAARWEAFADRERETILARAYSEERGFFTQALDGEFPDASNLLLPTIGIIDARDPRFGATLDA